MPNDEFLGQHALNLQSVMVSVCGILAPPVGGARASLGRTYAQLREMFLLHPGYSQFVPTIVRENDTLDKFQAAALSSPLEGQARHEWVISELNDLVMATQGMDPAPPPTTSGSSDTAADVAPPTATTSSEWTGRETVSELARRVRALAEPALAGVAYLLKESEIRLGNNPLEPLEFEGLEALRDLHATLGRLLALADAGSPIDATIDHLRALGPRVITFAAETGALCVAGVQAAAASVPLALGVACLLKALVSPETYVAALPTTLATIVGGHFAIKAAKSAPRN